MQFRDRAEAGKKLALRLLKYKSDNPAVIALPRGGVPVGFEIAKKLRAALDVVVVRKIGAPGNPEFGIGAIAEGDVQILDEPSIAPHGISSEYIVGEIAQESQELERRAGLYRQDQKLPDLKNKTVLLVDDGLATGVTVKAAIESVKKHNPKKVVVATPVCALESAEEIAKLVDDFVCLSLPQSFTSVGGWYDHFPQLMDWEVVVLLDKAKEFAPKRKTQAVSA